VSFNTSVVYRLKLYTLREMFISDVCVCVCVCVYLLLFRIGLCVSFLYCILAKCAASADPSATHLTISSADACDATATDATCSAFSCSAGYEGGSVTCQGDGSWLVADCTLPGIVCAKADRESEGGQRETGLS
jgi:hypothetical protein